MGEGSFFVILTEKGKNAAFCFKIGLHLDDIEVLEFIKDTLGFGGVFTHSNKVTFQVNKQSELKILIDIFSRYTLNTTKYLNFLAFKKAFELYTTNKSKSPEIMEEIKLLKNSMNSQRVMFKMPDDHKIRFNAYWVLGFIEGEGSFSIVKKNNYKLRFSIGQASRDISLMEALKEYFINLGVSHGLVASNLAFGLYRNYEGEGIQLA